MIYINYKGHLKSLDLMMPVIEEVRDVCETNNWKYRFVEEYFDLPEDLCAELGLEKGERYFRKGIWFEPHHECDMVGIIFDNKGRLVNFRRPDELKKMGSSGDYWTDILFWCRPLTLYSGPKVHKILSDFLSYLLPKYLNEYYYLYDSEDYLMMETEEEIVRHFVKEGGWQVGVEHGGLRSLSRMFYEETGDTEEEAIENLARWKKQLSDMKKREDQGEDDDDEGEEWKKLLE